MRRTNDDHVGRIALELSLKPFGRDDGRGYVECARDVVKAWRPLLEAADEVSFMLWVADGSDILEWRADLAQSLEWGRYIGFCNHEHDVYDGSHHPRSRNNILYTDSPKVMAYRDLRAIVDALRSAGSDLLERPITMGATFDPGPEFAASPFKYHRHPEIIVPKRVGGRPTFPMVDAATALHGDCESYAAYPNGIPEGEPFARFLGRQIVAYCRDMGFDYVWLSNGFGFSAVAWDYLGPGFDGDQFLPEVRAGRLERFKQAWDDLLEGNPVIPMEVRGSNFAAGMDIAKDGVDFGWLYETGYIRLPPPISPWGALNFDLGLEIAGYLSRAVKSPHGEYLFRYYPNDPWFWQNPWTDVFYGQAYDIHVPLATGVINQDGEITTPSTINILTGDTEFGETDPLTGVQVGAHMRTALNDRPDDVGLVTWIYPFEEYHGLAATGSEGQAEVFFGDWFVRSAINNGLPVATVGTPKAFEALLTHRDSVPQSVVFLPTAAARTGDDASRLLGWLARGMPAILYGPASSLHPIILEHLGIDLADPVSGELQLQAPDGSVSGVLIHDPVGSAGGIRARLVGRVGVEVTQRYVASQGDNVRAYWVSSTEGDRAPLIWIRGTNAFETRPDASRLALKPRPRDAQYLDTSQLCTEALETLGYVIRAESQVAGSAALMLFSRHDNAWFLSGYAAAPVGDVRLRFPEGAPVFHATYTRLVDGVAHYPLSRAMHHECRVFVRQAGGVVGCDTGPRDEHHRELTLRVTGLEDATVTFLPPSGFDVTLVNGDRMTRHPAGIVRVTESRLSGELLIRW